MNPRRQLPRHQRVSARFTRMVRNASTSASSASWRAYGPEGFLPTDGHMTLPSPRSRHSYMTRREARGNQHVPRGEHRSSQERAARLRIATSADCTSSDLTPRVAGKNPGGCRVNQMPMRSIARTLAVLAAQAGSMSSSHVGPQGGALARATSIMRAAARRRSR
jgi:hypothetical protein